MDLLDELRTLLAALESRRAPYALAGGMALAVHGVTRATTDLDLVVPGGGLDDVAAVARRLGFTIETTLRFASGLEILRLTKVAGAEALCLDLLRLPAELDSVWTERERVRVGALEISVVSRAGLVRMKLAAGRDQDLADVARLRELDA